MAKLATRTGVTAGPSLNWDSATRGTTATEYGGVYLYPTAYPTATHTFLETYPASGGSEFLLQIVATTGMLRVRDPVGADNVDFTTALSLNAWNRIEWEYLPASNTATVRLYAGHSTSLLQERTNTLAGTATQCKAAYCGIFGSTANLPTTGGFYYLDYFKTGQATWTGPAVLARQIRPDADNVTTGWTTTPLWSKIEETTADGTVITATAS